MNKPKVSEREIQELIIIYSELAAKYGIESTLTREEAIKSLQDYNPFAMASRQYVENLTRCFAEQIDRELVSLLNDDGEE